MALPEDFAAQCLYDPRAWFIHDLLSVDREARSVTALVDTTRLGDLVDAQIELPGHPKHLPGAVCVQLTGTLASLLAAYVLDMPRSEGWVGFGTHIHQAAFPSMGKIGPAVHAEATVISRRIFRGTTFLRYRYHFTQDERVVYRAEHSAAWLQAPADVEPDLT
ncbi:MAG TPA: hypothetical protein ENK18_19090 [Deltaproteobacteria bacterium]|nr:hypothetical protein [Deltaproteobacteria bacterium]